MNSQITNQNEQKNDLGQYARVCADIDLDAILENMNNMHANIKAGTKMCAVIKTNGYGHGSVPIAKVLEPLSYVWGYATATFEEAMELRQDGLKKPILILGYVFPYCYEKLVEEEIRPACFREDMLLSLQEVAKRLHKNALVHIAVDTGMSRIGIKPDDAGLRFVEKATSLEGITVEGMFTHFAKADEIDKQSALHQMHEFQAFSDRITERIGHKLPIVHCSNSAGIVELPDANMDMVRAGVTLYGMWPSNEVKKDIVPLKPALSLHSHIVFIKEVPEGTPVSYGGTYVTKGPTRIATIPTGYGDGYPRGLSNKGSVLIRGKRFPIIGRVCMDQFMVDITSAPEICEGDLVTLIGRDQQEEITIEELGDLSGRFNYELACDINQRVPRRYEFDNN